MPGPPNGNHWLKIRLNGISKGTGKKTKKMVNAFAIGAQVRVHVGTWRLTRQVEGGTGEGNQNDLTLHFGLGKQSDPVTIEVRWPDGTRQTAKSGVDTTLQLARP